MTHLAQAHDRIKLVLPRQMQSAGNQMVWNIVNQSAVISGGNPSTFIRISLPEKERIELNWKLGFSKQITVLWHNCK